jgi:hypothetical protein
MNPALLIALFSALFLAAGIVVTIVAFRRAPHGYEDETGFHALPTPKEEVETPVVTSARPEFRFGALHAGLSPAGGDLPDIRDMVGR